MAFSPSLIRNSSTKVKLSWLDLRGCGLSAIERLCLEEVLLRHDNKDRSWVIVGTHEPTRHRFLQLPPYNSSCIIVMGIGGKPEKLLNMNLVRKDGVLVVKRFSGGGTVVLDHDSIWTTLIGRSTDFPEVEAYPRPIMQWSADCVFGPAFSELRKQAQETRPKAKRSTLMVDSKSCSATENSGRVLELPKEPYSIAMDIPDFALIETDYVLGNRKMGGNAQAIVKGGWLHHTSFLWDYHEDHMAYLNLPEKRPEYRGDRPHDDFLVKLSTHYGHLGMQAFFAHVKDSLSERFEMESVTVNEALAIVHGQVGGLQNWFETKCRTKIVDI